MSAKLLVKYEMKTKRQKYKFWQMSDQYCICTLRKPYISHSTDCVWAKCFLPFSQIQPYRFSTLRSKRHQETLIEGLGIFLLLEMLSGISTTCIWNNLKMGRNAGSRLDMATHDLYDPSFWFFNQIIHFKQIFLISPVLTKQSNTKARAFAQGNFLEIGTKNS